MVLLPGASGASLPKQWLTDQANRRPPGTAVASETGDNAAERRSSLAIGAMMSMYVAEARIWCTRLLVALSLCTRSVNQPLIRLPMWRNG